MGDFQNAQTIGTLFHGVSKRALKASAAFAAVSALLYTGFTLKTSQEHAQQLIMKQVLSQVQSAYMDQDILSVERELNRFVEAWDTTQPLSVEVRVFLADKLIASDGEAKGPDFIKSSILQTLKLPSGEPLRIEASLSPLAFLGQALLLLALLELSIFFLFFWLDRRSHSAVKAIVEPLGEIVGWLESVAGNLPESIQTNPKPLPSSVLEVQKLRGSIGTLFDQIVSLEERLRQVHLDQAKIEIAEKVGHDLKSPLGTMTLLINQNSQLPVERKVELRDALKRMRSIVQTLRTKRDKPLTESTGIQVLEPQELKPLIDAVIREKQIQNNTRHRLEIRSVYDGNICAEVDGADFQRTLSNILDNAIQATPGAGQVEVTLSLADEMVELRITDSGAGIPAHVLPKLMKRGSTFGRPDGSGLGLFYAKESVESWGGRISIDSTLGKGTSVLLTFPGAPFTGFGVVAPSITFAPGQTIVICDDSACIHDVWSIYLKKIHTNENGIDVVHLNSPQELTSWRQENSENISNCIFLMDYEFEGEEINGLDIIEQFDISTSSYLITGRATDENVRERCNSLQVPLIDKDSLHLLRLTVDHKFIKTHGRSMGRGVAAQFSNLPESQVANVEV